MAEAQADAILVSGHGGGTGATGYVNSIEQMTIASTGNATDFGDLSTEHGQFAASSNCHGGVQ